MPRKWNNSKGIGVDHERAVDRSLDRLRRELMKPEVYYATYRRNKKTDNRKGKK